MNFPSTPSLNDEYTFNGRTSGAGIVYLTWTVAAGLTAGHGTVCQSNANGAYLSFSAEL